MKARSIQSGGLYQDLLLTGSVMVDGIDLLVSKTIKFASKALFTELVI